MKSLKISLLILILVIAALAFGFGLWTYHNTPKKERPASAPLELASGTLLPQPRDIQPFQLIDKNNQKFTDQNLKNQWSFVFFGFTHCQMVCPTTLTNLQHMYQQLKQNHIKSLPRIVFISVDPEQDSPAQLSRYLNSFNPNFEGATGDKQELDILTKQFNIVYSKVFPDGAGTHYSIEHSGAILLVNPKGQFYAVFTSPHDPKKMASDFIKISQ